MADIALDLQRAKKIIDDNEDQEETQDFIFPFGTSSMMISARSQQGKTELIKHLISEQRFVPAPQHIIVISDHVKNTPYYEMAKSVTTLYPNTTMKLTSYNDPNWQHEIDRPNTLLVMDDLTPHMNEKNVQLVLNEYVTQGRHTQRSLIWVTHNIFLPQVKTARDNSHISAVFHPAQEKLSVDRHIRNILGEKGVSDALMRKLLQLQQGEFYLIATTPQSPDRLIYDHNFKNIKLY